MLYIITGSILIVGFVAVFRKQMFGIIRRKGNPMIPSDRAILAEHISFYNALSSEKKKQFETRIQNFLANVIITGVQTDVDRTDQLLIGASAIIPIFSFEGWVYRDLKEIILYPNAFNTRFETQGKDRNILGLVGQGFMEGKMIISKRALHLGFSNSTDKRNTAIHEFLHLIDDADGMIDGLPYALKDYPAVVPWMDFMERKIDEIKRQKSDINPYGATNKAEFFAVTGEYFFERPQLLKKKHPELYGYLDRWFNAKN